MKIGEYVWWVGFSQGTGRIFVSMEQVVIIGESLAEGLYQVKTNQGNEFFLDSSNLFHDKRRALNDSIRKLQETLFNE